LVRQLGGRAGVATAKIFSGWAEAVGPSVAAHAEPLALHGATLVVGVDAPAYATQLRLLAPQLLARLGDLVGVGAVDAIEVRVRG
jgi:predicted nucleic acid-binding Zn ribbon protein